MAKSATFGTTIRDARRAKNWTQKDLARLVIKEDGVSISAQFMNDIELERRFPSRHVIDSLGPLLDLDPLYLRVLAGQPPSDRPASDYPRERVQRAIRAYRLLLGEGVTTRPPSANARRRTR